MAVLDAPKVPVKRNLREERGLGHAYICIGRDQRFFRLAHIGAPLQQCGRKARGDIGQMRLFDKLEAARDRAGISSEKNAELFSVCGVNWLSEMTSASACCTSNRA